MRKKKPSILPPAPGAGYRADREQLRNVIGQRLTAELKHRRISKKAFCHQLKDYGVDVTESSFGKWTNGTTIPSAYQLLAVCHALALPDVLAFFTEGYAPPLDEAGLEKLRSYRDDLIASGRYAPAPASADCIRYLELPVSDLRVSAGTGSFLDEGSFTMVSFPETAVPQGAEFGIRVSGDSMEPVYHDGQIVWVKPCETLLPGQVGVFVYDGEGFLKVYGEQAPEDAEAFTDNDGTLRMQPVLLSYNQAYPPRSVEPERGFRVVGRVL